MSMGRFIPLLAPTPRTVDAFRRTPLCLWCWAFAAGTGQCGIRAISKTGIRAQVRRSARLQRLVRSRPCARLAREESRGWPRQVLPTLVRCRCAHPWLFAAASSHPFPDKRASTVESMVTPLLGPTSSRDRVAARETGCRHIFTIECLPPGQHFIQHAAEREDVRPAIHHPALCLFRRHVRCCADNDSAHCSAQHGW